MILLMLKKIKEKKFNTKWDLIIKQKKTNFYNTGEYFILAQRIK